MDARLEELNTLFVDTFDAIMRVEEKSLKQVGNGELSIAEFHTLECIGKGKDCRRAVGEIAEALGVTVPTVTVCVNKLVKKGYVTKTRSEKDARIAIIELTPEGRKMNRLHRYFHEQMILAVRGEFSDEELDSLLRCIRKLNAFFGEHA
ncbi:MAG: winged helix-turn-helix transcriptional regulator [Clostridia bacterium]|nr:winged helix-turn-helix transcriptional regulator [Clostridia bacterium]